MTDGPLATGDCASRAHVLALAATTAAIGLLILPSHACAPFDAEPGSESSQLEAGANDAALPDARGDAAVDDAPLEGTNLVLDPGFGVDWRNTWGSYNGERKDGAIGRSGAAGLVCAKPGGALDSFSLDTELPVPSIKAGETYRGEMWLRLAAGVSATRLIHLELRTWVSDKSSALEHAASADKVLTAEWQRHRVELTTTKEAKGIDFFAAAPVPLGSADCFIADDAVVVRLAP